MSKPRILIVGTIPPPITGQSVALQMLVEGLGDDYDLRIVDMSDRESRRDKSFSLQRGLNVLTVAYQAWKKARGCELGYLTVAQSRFGFLRDALILWVLYLRRIPVVIHLHGGNYAGFYAGETSLFQWMIRKALCPVKRFIVLSDNLKDQFDFLGSNARTRVVVVLNGCAANPGSARSAPEKTLQLLYLSNLVVEKGYQDCIDALPHIQRLLPDVDVRLVLAGGLVLGVDEYDSIAQMNQEMEKHIRYMGVSNKVNIPGLVSGEEKDRLLKESDIMLLPTYYINEGQPLTIIEALANGQPVVATAWRGIQEMIEDGETGAFVPAKNPLAIAEAVARIAGSPGDYERMSRNAVASSERFSVQNHVARMREVFEDVLREGS